ncbi:MAG: zf-HC2 domain-containing protein [Holophagales bacterium]|nr:zf-HC2 domain-containing protein [Holophagales bacterium]
MSCTPILELLPWFANGTLDADDRQRVEAHLATCESCRATLEDTVALGSAAARHLPIDLLLDLADGAELAAEDSELARRHLAECPACAAELAWARVDDDEPEAAPAFPRSEERTARARPSPWLALAATALVAASITWLLTSQPWSAPERPDRRLYEPIVNPLLVELVPETLRRGDSTVPTLELDTRSSHLTLVLISELRPPAETDLLLELVGPNPEASWTGEGLRRTDSGMYTLLLPTADLVPGEYRARILTAGPAPEEALEEFRFEVVESTRPR